MPSSRLLAAAAASLLTACGALQPTARVHAGTTTTPNTAVTVPRQEGSRQPLVDPDRPDAPSIGGGASRPTTASERRVCRRGTWPSGWIAVAYEMGDEGCPARQAKEDHGVAVLVRLTGQPRAAVLVVCGDQHAPVGWIDDGDAGSGDQCDRSGVRRIRKR